MALLLCELLGQALLSGDVSFRLRRPLRCCSWVGVQK